MRRSATHLAALLLALALASAGCKPSSLAPFWIGTKGQEDAGANINGVWNGATDTGGAVRLMVADSDVADIVLDHSATGCVMRFEITGRSIPVADDEFFAEVELEPQGRFVITGRFGSSVCAGSFFFEGAAAASICPTSGSGQFTAQKQ